MQDRFGEEHPTRIKELFESKSKKLKHHGHFVTMSKKTKTRRC